MLTYWNTLYPTSSTRPVFLLDSSTLSSTRCSSSTTASLPSPTKRDRLTSEWNNINWHTVYSTQKNYQKRLVAEYRNNTNMAGVNRLQREILENKNMRISAGLNTGVHSPQLWKNIVIAVACAKSNLDRMGRLLNFTASSLEKKVVNTLLTT